MDDIVIDVARPMTTILTPEELTDAGLRRVLTDAMLRLTAVAVELQRREKLPGTPVFMKTQCNYSGRADSGEPELTSYDIIVETMLTCTKTNAPIAEIAQKVDEGRASLRHEIEADHSTTAPGDASAESTATESDQPAEK